MLITDNFSENGNSKSKREFSQHSVVVHFLYGIEELDPLHNLDTKLNKQINDAGVGVYDWHEIAMDSSHGFLFMYGPNAEKLFKTVLPTLKKCPFMKGAVAHLRFGALDEEGVPEIEVEI